MTANRLTKRARGLRQTANAPKQVAWQALRQLRVHGYPTRRQFPVGVYIVDFAIPKARLVIEIDGGIHRLEQVQARDERREEDIRNLGWNVVRFSATEAMNGEWLLAEMMKRLGLL